MFRYFRLPKLLDTYKASILIGNTASLQDGDVFLADNCGLNPCCEVQV